MQTRSTDAALQKLALLLVACTPGVAVADLGESWSVELADSLGETRAIDSGGRFLTREFRAGAWWRDAIGGHLEGRLLDDVAGFGPMAARVDLGIGWRLASTPTESLDLITAARWIASEIPDALFGPDSTGDPSPLAVIRYRAEFTRGIAFEAAGEVAGSQGEDGGGSWGVRSGLRLELDSGWALRLEATVRSDADELFRALQEAADSADRTVFWLGLSKSF